MLLTTFCRTARAAVLIAAGAFGTTMLAGALFAFGLAPPGPVVAPWWVAAQPDIQAIGGGVGPPPCLIHARRYRANPAYVPPPRCLNTRWFQGLPPPGEPAPAPVAP